MRCKYSLLNPSNQNSKQISGTYFPNHASLQQVLPEIWSYNKGSADNFLNKDPKLSSAAFPHCHLRLAVNLHWTSLLVFPHYQSTDLLFLLTAPRVLRKKTPLLVPPLLPLLLSESENIWKTPRSCIHDFPLCGWEQTGPYRLPSWMSRLSVARLSVMGCGRATEAPGRAVNNYRDVSAAVRRAALTAVTHSQGTVRRWRSVRSRSMILLPRWIIDWVIRPGRWEWGNIRGWAQVSERDKIKLR